jgi:Ca2+-binding RTX toxin-like protein
LTTFAYNVYDTNDSGQGSLRQAILDAYTIPGVNTITFEGEIFADGVPDTITLTSGELMIASELIIEGLGAEAIIVSGNNQFPVFVVDDNDYDSLSEVSIKGLTITEGQSGIVNRENLTVENSVISHNRAGEGGGIENFGDLNLLNSTVSNNISEEDGAGVLNSGNLTVIDSAIVGNESETEQGGGLYHVGNQMTVINSTISENVAYGAAGILNGGGSTATISHSTIYNNSSLADSGGIRNVGELSITHSIVAGNTATTDQPDVDGYFVVSQGYNLIGTATESIGFTNGVNGDQVGTSSHPIDPLLGSLQNNGGFTETHALLAGSPAIDAGDPDLTSLPEFDQRGSGFPRILDGDNDGTATIDIGAFESEFPPPTADIIGTPGDDHLRGTDNGEQIFGLAGDDHMRGRDGNDEIFGGPGDDRIRGDDDNDTLMGGPGDDRMLGGDGSDTFVLAAGEGTDVIQDFELSEGDQIGLAGGLQFSQLNFESDQILLGTEVLAEVRGFDTSSLTSSNFVTI